MIEPDRQAMKVLLHADECKACASFMREQQALEHDLRNLAMMPVPEQLASRILLHQGTQVRRQSLYQRRWLAAAMSMVFAVTLIMSFDQQAIPVSVDQPAAPLAVEQLVLTHIHDEPQHLEDQLNVQKAELDMVLAGVGMTMSSGIGLISYVGECLIRNEKKAVHMVLQEVNGPVTVLFMPDESVVVRTPIQDQRFQGVVYPARYGSIAVVGEKGESIEAIEQKINRAVGYIS
jgi:hypothetical protein